MPVGSLILLSCFAFFGIYYFVQILIDELFCSGTQKAVTVIPLCGDTPLELISPARSCMFGEKMVVVDLTRELDLNRMRQEDRWWDAVTTPEELSETVLKMIR